MNFEIGDIIVSITSGESFKIINKSEKYFTIEEIGTKYRFIYNKDDMRNFEPTLSIKFTKQDLFNCWPFYIEYFVDILNKEYDLDQAIEDLRSLIGTKFDLRANDTYEE